MKSLDLNPQHAQVNARDSTNGSPDRGRSIAIEQRPAGRRCPTAMVTEQVDRPILTTRWSEQPAIAWAILVVALPVGSWPALGDSTNDRPERPPVLGVAQSRSRLRCGDARLLLDGGVGGPGAPGAEFPARLADLGALALFCVVPSLGIAAFIPDPLTARGPGGSSRTDQRSLRIFWVISRSQILHHFHLSVPTVSSRCCLATPIERNRSWLRCGGLVELGTPGEVEEIGSGLDGLLRTFGGDIAMEDVADGGQAGFVQIVVRVQRSNGKLIRHGHGVTPITTLCGLIDYETQCTANVGRPQGG